MINKIKTQSNLEKRKKLKRIVYSLLVIMVGLVCIVYAGIDDSPGGQLLGFLAIFGGFWCLIVRRKKE
ncbi:hypothetical protein ACFL2L_01285 [Patescibacteria group bacterium]